MLGTGSNPTVLVSGLVRDAQGHLRRALPARALQVSGADLGPARDVSQVDVTAVAVTTRPDSGSDQIAVVELDGSPRVEGQLGPTVPASAPGAVASLLASPDSGLPLRVVGVDHRLLHLHADRRRPVGAQPAHRCRGSGLRRVAGPPSTAGRAAWSAAPHRRDHDASRCSTTGSTSHSDASARAVAGRGGWCARRAGPPCRPGRRRCGPTRAPKGLAPAFAAAEYADPLRRMVLLHKERRMFGLARPLGEVLAGPVLAATPARGRTVLVPVPSRPGVVRSRGHDPMLRVARVAAGVLRATGTDVTVMRIVRQRGPVADQSGLGAADRAANLAGSMVGAPRCAAGAGSDRSGGLGRRLRRRDHDRLDGAGGAAGSRGRGAAGSGDRLRRRHPTTGSATEM